MSYFSTALQRLTEQRRMSQTDLAKSAGLSKSFLSRLFSGEAADVSETNFVALLKTFSPSAQAELLAARCHDIQEIARAAGLPGAALLQISVQPAAGKPTPPTSPAVQLPDNTERVLAWLRTQIPLNPELEKTLTSYARLAGMHD